MHTALATFDIYREIITLYHLEGMLCEIADITGLPMGTVMNRLFRARRSRMHWKPSTRNRPARRATWRDRPAREASPAARLSAFIDGKA